jgi:sigma-B regulation protein RsbU (phosphoserine phosphatase)
MTLNPTESSPDSQTMRCMEIWGGNRAVREAIATPGLDIWVFSQPYHGEARGGDVHYVSLCGGGIITRLIVADVSGHGTEVAGFSQGLRNLMRRNINSKTQKRLVKALNRQFAELAQLQRFATAIVATYLATDRRLTVCNAAHPRPLWFRAATDTWSILSHEAVNSVESAMNLPLGIDEEATYDQFSFRLEPGDLIIFYTDALTEAMDPSGNLLGEPGLLKIAKNLNLERPEQIVPALVEAIKTYRSGVEAEDDVTLLLLRQNGGKARKPSIAEKLDVYAKVFGIKSI